MPEEERLRLKAITERIALVNSWVEAMTEAEFLSDLMVRDAAAMSLLVLGETARRLSDDTRRQSPEIPWSAIISLRNRIAHGYETVDHRLVWRVIEDDLPSLAETIDRLLSSSG